MTDFRGEITDNETVARRSIIITSMYTSCKFDALYFTDNYNFYGALNSKFNVVCVRVSNSKHGINHETLSDNCMLSP